MPSYFRQVPNFEYVSRLPDAKISDYIVVKNLFKKGFLREDIFQDLTFFTKYQIKGDDRPDNVAFEVYGDSTYDWLVLLCNNIINIQSEWPLLQRDFEDYLLNKYGDYDILYNGIHHYETKEIKNNQGVIVVPSGLQVESDYTVSFYDNKLKEQTVVNNSDCVLPVTNYQFEENIENNKRNIYLLKDRYLNVVNDDLQDIMAYREGSTQYVSETLKRADNIRLYQ